jgi:hypothetical protein
MNLNLHIHATAVDQSNMLSFLTVTKRSRYNLTKLYGAIKKEIQDLDQYNICHISTYPCIGVHVVNRNANYLADNKDEIRRVIQRTLWEWQK